MDGERSTFLVFNIGTSTLTKVSQVSHWFISKENSNDNRNPVKKILKNSKHNWEKEEERISQTKVTEKSETNLEWKWIVKDINHLNI